MTALITSAKFTTAWISTAWQNLNCLIESQLPLSQYPMPNFPGTMVIQPQAAMTVILFAVFSFQSGQSLVAIKFRGAVLLYFKRSYNGSIRFNQLWKYTKQSLYQNNTHPNCTVCVRQEQHSSVSERTWYSDIAENQSVVVSHSDAQQIQNLDILRNLWFLA
jgi:hypothetical protein